MLSLVLALVTALAHAGISASLCVDVIDVGQGDSIYLHAADGTDILIDGGPPSAGPTVVAHLQAAGVDDIDVLILTHAHSDHVGGLVDVLRSGIPVESWIYSGQHGTTDTYQAFLAETQKRGLTPTPAVAGQSYTWGPIEAHVLNPQPVPIGDLNADSVALLLTCGEVRFLFAADITTATEQVLLGSDSLRPWLPADILKVAHHGCADSSSAPFLAAVEPDVAVISVGSGNPDERPSQEILDRFAAVGAALYRTDEDGTVTVLTDGATYEVHAENGGVFPPPYAAFVPAIWADYKPAPRVMAASMPKNMPRPTATPIPAAPGE